MTIRLDVVVVGGGIAGLWMLALLRESGYSALLLETAALGGGQTMSAQGIIHGGTKYSLEGALTGAAKAIAAMPGEWRRALEGTAAVDLSGARVLSESQYLWSNSAPGPRISAFFASKVMRARMRALPRSALPEPFATSSFEGTVYELDEPVVDVATVVQRLQAKYRDWLLEIAPEGLERLPTGAGPVDLRARSSDGRTLEIRAQRLALCAAAGNTALGERLDGAEAKSQRRPLKMVLVRGALPELFGHAMGVGGLPRITVTSHCDDAGRQLWYLGGALAENGVGLSRAEQLRNARDELRATLPWIAQEALQWAILDVDRIEAQQAGGKRPDSVVLRYRGPVAAAWPTKLALAPALAQQYLAQLDREGVQPSTPELDGLDDWPRPAVAPRPWDLDLEWS